MSDCTVVHVPFENDLRPLQRDSVPSGGRFRRVTPSSEREYSMLDTDRARDSLADNDADADADDDDCDCGGVCVGDGVCGGGADSCDDDDDNSEEDDNCDCEDDCNDNGSVCV
jgi:hypothetical protein